MAANLTLTFACHYEQETRDNIASDLSRIFI